MPMRLSIAAPITLIAALAVTPAKACWLTDCLFGRQPTSYAVSYAPAVATPHVTAYPPTVITTLPAGTNPTTTSYRATYPTQANLATSYRPAYTTSGAYQTQRPAYIDNPSVYTGLPVNSARPAYRAATTNVPAASSTTIVPSTNIGTSYGANYGAAQAPTATP